MLIKQISFDFFLNIRVKPIMISDRFVVGTLNLCLVLGLFAVG